MLEFDGSEPIREPIVMLELRLCAKSIAAQATQQIGLEPCLTIGTRQEITATLFSSGPIAMTAR